jgi:hypothetical protein
MNSDMSLIDTSKDSERQIQECSRPASTVSPNPFGVGLQTIVDNKKLNDSLKIGIDTPSGEGYNQVTNIAYVPVAFPSYATNYAPNAVYGYSLNGISPLPVYSYNTQMAEKDKEAWAASKQILLIQ